MKSKNELKTKASEILQKAKNLVENGWCQSFEAVDENGKKTRGVDDASVSFCVWGSISRAGQLNSKARWNAFMRFKDVIKGIDIALWNDQKGRQKEDVLQKFDEAIALAKNQGD